MIADEPLDSPTHLDLIRSARRAARARTGPRRASSDHPRIPGYDLISEISRGGQGVVLRAVQRSTGQDVAIKILRHGTISTAAEQGRLQREIAILGSLKHPSIVSIHDSGHVDGLGYIVMDYIEGRPLDVWVADQAPAHGDLVALLRRIAEAVHAAHLRGVIHRDLKPANILVDADGLPHIVDFGLATRTTLSAESRVTNTGQLLGSLQWCAPEQVRGDHDNVDVRTDVYALGVIFWQALTGGFPYDVSGSFRDVVDAITEKAPASPPSSTATLRGDVETILRKCLAKAPERRYQNAGDLAADLQHYLDGEAIQARRDSQWYVLRRAMVRHRIIVGALGAIALVTCAASIALGTLYTQAERNRQRAQQSAYRANLNAASASVLPTDAGVAAATLDLAPPELRGWEWHYLHGIMDESVQVMRAPDVTCGAAWTPDGKRVVTGSFDRAVRIWDADTGEQIRTLDGHTDIIFDVAVSPDGSRIASCGRDRTVRLWDAADGTLQRTLIAPERVTDCAFSPDGRLIAAAASYCDIVILWDVATGEEVFRLPPHPPLVAAVAFSPDGTLIATGSNEYGGGAGRATIRIHRADDGTLVHELAAASWSVNALAFAPDGGRLAAASSSDSVKVWDLRDAERPPVRLHEIGRQVSDVRFMRDGDRVISVGKDGLVHVSDSRTGERLDTFRGHHNSINHVALSPDDRRACTTGADGTVRIWDLTTHRGYHVLSGHQHGVDAILFSSDGTSLFSASRDSTIGVWSTSSWTMDRRLEAHSATVGCLAITDDGAVLASGNLDPDTPGPDGAVYLWDRDGKGRLLAGNLPGIYALAFRPGTGRLYAATRTGDVLAWDIDAGTSIPIPQPLRDAMQLGFSPSGRYLVVIAMTGVAYVCDGTTGALERTLAVPEADRAHFPKGIAFSADEALLAIGAKTGITTIWSTETWKEVARVGERGDPIVGTVAFNPDGSRLAIGGDIGVTIVETTAWTPLLALRDVTDVYSVAFSPDGHDLAAASSDGTVRVWTTDLPLGDAP